MIGGAADAGMLRRHGLLGLGTALSRSSIGWPGRAAAITPD